MKLSAKDIGFLILATQKLVAIKDIFVNEEEVPDDTLHQMDLVCSGVEHVKNSIHLLMEGDTNYGYRWVCR